MPILQDKLVIKSIEALHDEAISLMPNTASNSAINAPPTVLHGSTPLRKSAIDTPKDTSADAPPESACDSDIMARIDHLLKKLDEDDYVDIELPASEEPKSNMGRMTGDASHTVTTDNTETDNPANPNSHVLSDTTKHANENAKLNVTVDSMVEDTATKPFDKTDNDTYNAAKYTSDDIFADDKQKETASADQTKALANIAEAIYQARQQSVDGKVAVANPDKALSSDMGVLSATVADEVRRTVSAVIIAELPKMVRDAVIEAIRILPADTLGHSTPTTVNPSTAKSVTTRKTATTKKAVAKKARTKKAGTKKRPGKKATGKTAPSV